MRYANEMIVEELKQDREFLLDYLKNAINTIYSGIEVKVGCLMLRNVVNATIGFKELGVKLGKSDKNLMQMLTVTNSPQLINIMAIIDAVLNDLGLQRKPIDIEDKTAA